jgi:hypothetical protein
VQWGKLRFETMEARGASPADGPQRRCHSRLQWRDSTAAPSKLSSNSASFVSRCWLLLLAGPGVIFQGTGLPQRWSPASQANRGFPKGFFVISFLLGAHV